MLSDDFLEVFVLFEYLFIIQNLFVDLFAQLEIHSFEFYEGLFTIFNEKPLLVREKLWYDIIEEQLAPDRVFGIIIAHIDLFLDIFAQVRNGDCCLEKIISIVAWNFTHFSIIEFLNKASETRDRNIDFSDICLCLYSVSIESVD